MRKYNNWEFLKDKNCIDILIGIHIDEHSYNENIMPYLTGNDICKLCNNFGMSVVYNETKLSRSQYMKNLIDFCIEKNKMSELLNNLFKIENYKNHIYGQNYEKIMKTHEHFIGIAINEINNILVFSKVILFENNNYYYIKDLRTEFKIETPTIEFSTSIDYIHSICSKAIDAIKTEDYDSAITKSRTLLEEVFIHIIEHNKQEVSAKGDIGKLYNQVKTIYSLHNSKDADKQINELLNGLQKIVTAIGNMRNIGSDAHGTGSKRFKLEKHHATLFVNTAIVFTEFILSVHNKKYHKDIP